MDPTSSDAGRTRRSRAAPSLRPLAGAAVLLVLLALSGCAAQGAMAKDPFRGAAGMQSIRIEVRNLNWNDATLHALRGGVRHRLGIVTGKTDEVYTMDWPSSLPLQIEIDLLAGGECVTRPMQVDPGDIVMLQIEITLSSDPDCRRR